MLTQKWCKSFLMFFALLPVCQAASVADHAGQFKVFFPAWPKRCHDLAAFIQKEVRLTQKPKETEISWDEEGLEALRQFSKVQMRTQGRGPPTRLDWHATASQPENIITPTNAHSWNLAAASNNVVVTIPRRNKPPQTHTKMAKQLAFPSVALCIGLAMLPSVLTRNVAKIIVFFGMQTFMNLFMKAMLSTAEVSEARNIIGFQAPFFITSIQQGTSTGIFLLGLLLLRPTRWRYTPRCPETAREWCLVAASATTFTLSIALNNFSLMLLPISLNLVIRSCSPLVMFIAEKAMCKTPIRPLEVALMAAGVFSALSVGVAEVKGYNRDDHTTFMLGTICCLASLAANAVNMILANYLESEYKLNSIDTMVYMTLPAFLFLWFPTFRVMHPVSWPGYGRMTDWAVVLEVSKMSGGIVSLAVFSGLFACVYNVLMLLVVGRLSIDHVASTSTINKAATIALALSVGLEIIPLKPWDTVLLLGVTGNTLAFLIYSISSGGSTHKSVSTYKDERKAML